jgi:hypothetical protein
VTVLCPDVIIEVIPYRVSLPTVTYAIYLVVVETAKATAVKTKRNSRVRASQVPCRDRPVHRKESLCPATSCPSFCTSGFGREASRNPLCLPSPFTQITRASQSLDRVRIDPPSGGPAPCPENREGSGPSECRAVRTYSVAFRTEPRAVSSRTGSPKFTRLTLRYGALLGAFGGVASAHQLAHSCWSGPVPLRARPPKEGKSARLSNYMSVIPSEHVTSRPFAWGW